MTELSIVPAPAPDVPSDEEVVRRVRAGEVALFELLMRRHNQRVYRAIRSLLRDEAEVEDAMQQAYLHAWARLSQWTGEAPFRAWLIRIAVNEALSRLRPGRRPAVREVDEEEQMDPGARDPERQAGARELLSLLEEAVDRLPVLYRTAFMLREIEGLSTAETAGCLGLSPEVVKVRLHRARAALRTALLDRAERQAHAAFPFLAPRCDRVVRAVLARLPGPESPRPIA
ncbi:RNA polymerase sigma factor [Anaeromyxobacter paludicola]|uniref:RNA polymerase sigma factor n=1 Tax=Anaeromyxobacter paludicola TaxID=2918171 RepID=A0ABM7XFH9_9BACT|nr:RNA polymerase sigma factor [Anaeromyxobacter paludicola]BDG10634.1 RNA polymerase sigma factor [Anaeromyxobacter paludicola]